MTPVLLILVIFTLQLLFQFSRSLGTRYLAKDNMHAVASWGFVIQVLWLVTTWLGVKAMDAMDPYLISAYLIGGVLGIYLNYWVSPPKKA